MNNNLNKNAIQVNAIIKNKSEIINILSEIFKKESTILIWQKTETSRNVIQHVSIKKINNDKSSMVIDCNKLVSFSTDHELMCNDYKNYIFKSKINFIDNELVEINIPSTITVYSDEAAAIIRNVTEKVSDNMQLIQGGTSKDDIKNKLVKGSKEDSTDNELQKIKGNNSPVDDNESIKISKGKDKSNESKTTVSVNLKGPSLSFNNVMKVSTADKTKEQKEDEYFKNKRISERKKFNSSQSAFVVKKSEIDKVEPKEYKILDLSTGGIGLELESKEDYSPGTKIILVEIAGQKVSKEGEVRSIRPKENGCHKMGVIFR